MKKLIGYLTLSSALVAPVIVSAASFRSLEDGIQSILDIINLLIPLIIGLAILYFLWGVLQYVTKGNEKEGREEAKWIMIWGIIAIFVMVSVWGLVNILHKTFGLDNSPAELPSIHRINRSNQSIDRINR